MRLLGILATRSARQETQIAQHQLRKLRGVGALAWGWRRYRTMAEADIGPEELARLRAQGPKIAKQRITQEADRIRKKTERFAEFVWTLSPEELSD